MVSISLLRFSFQREQRVRSGDSCPFQCRLQQSNFYILFYFCLPPGKWEETEKVRNCLYFPYMSALILTIILKLLGSYLISNFQIPSFFVLVLFLSFLHPFPACSVGCVSVLRFSIWILRNLRRRRKNWIFWSMLVDIVVVETTYFSAVCANNNVILTWIYLIVVFYGVSKQQKAW